MFCGACGAKYVYEVENESTSAESQESLIEKGIQHIELGNLSFAEQIFHTLTMNYPDNYKGWLGGAILNCLTGEEKIPNGKQNALRLMPEDVRRVVGTLEMRDEHEIARLNKSIEEALDKRKNVMNQQIDLLSPAGRIEMKMKIFGYRVLSIVKPIFLIILTSLLLLACGGSFCYMIIGGIGLIFGPLFGETSGQLWLLFFCALILFPVSFRASNGLISRMRDGRITMTYFNEIRSLKSKYNYYTGTSVKNKEAHDKYLLDSMNYMDSLKQQIAHISSQEPPEYYIDVLKKLD